MTRESGFAAVDLDEWVHCGVGACAARHLPGTPIADQARALAAQQAAAVSPQRGDFTRLRDMWIRWTAPIAFAGRLGVHELQVTMSAHDLSTWTSFTGHDPEVGLVDGGGYFRSNEGVLPIPRTISLRLELAR
jgi:hypothetical protein